MIGKIAISLALSALIPAGIALGLVASQAPRPMAGEGGLDFSRQMARTEALPVQSVAMRDGFALQVRHVAGPEGAPLLVMVHGSGWHGGQYDALARALEGQAEMLIPDLRGHGAQPGRRGDVDHIGQLEDDLADLIAAYRKPGQKVIALGHSSGGGLVVRMAGGSQGGALDGAILLAPFLKYNASTTRPNSGGWAQPLTRRIIGLTMLNAAHIRALNHLTVIQFNMPRAVLDGPLGHTATTAYSYRLNTSYAPRNDYEADIAALPPFLLAIGDRDEAFVPDQYQPLMQPLTDKGRYAIVPGASHLDVVNDPQTLALIQEFLREF
ncbi:alpha/beta fold hydrolase [Thalassobius vesicularis]|uniref:Alpha/beta fold hydrolase n=1 Tax=Thalassobius vesicularis TaxID=1294297 RepID=A0A4S3M9B8_9RHOB|nr:alpha/beta fold hydrolase [Thalassobius vesicularis]THD74668.1 alpha/beta fold hydrolase [Thalassobius vesicularis]